VKEDWQLRGGKGGANLQQHARMLKHFLEVVIVGVLWAQEAHQFFGHRFGQDTGAHQAASKKEDRVTSSSNSLDLVTQCHRG
jgi:hypothetical protein